MSIQRVIEGGFCIGCGACRVVDPRFRLEQNQFGDLVARLPEGLNEGELARASSVCPFSAPVDETQLAVETFGRSPELEWHGEVGAVRRAWAAYAPEFRASGSSGGMATWMLGELFRRDLIDAAIHVGPSFNRPDGRRFSYRISATVEELATGSTSFYHPVSLDEVMEVVRAREGRYAITGVPCFQKALRLVRRTDTIIDRRLRYQIGIVCGQMKSAHYLNYLASLAGATEPLRGACFRRKVAGFPADDYAFEVEFERAGQLAKAQVMNTRIGVNWGMGYFKPQACDFCDDVLAETADVAVMDAWLPQYVKDGAGWSLVVVRSTELSALHDDALKAGQIVAIPVSADQVAESQRGGFNHRRAGLAYRLWQRQGSWTPSKRIVAENRLSPLLQLEQRLRSWLRERSRGVWRRHGRAGGVSAFRRRMIVPELIYKMLQRVKRRLRVAPPPSYPLKP